MANNGDVASLHERAVAGRVGALAMLISLADRDPLAVAPFVWGLPGKAEVVGITGSPGAGKSTLTSAIVGHCRQRGERVAVLAVDPTSPISGGAVLGDRIRMLEHTLDPDVYIRSMATRGFAGGLSSLVPLAIRVLESVGFDTVLVETVGVGQVELDIAAQTDTVLVVLSPGWGDGIQANKAGILEIADVFVVNKADRTGSHETVAELRAAQSLGSGDGGWTTSPIVETVAIDGKGIEELMDAVAQHQAELDVGEDRDRDARRRQRAARHLSIVVNEHFNRMRDQTIASIAFELTLNEVSNRTLDPWTASSRLMAETDG